LANVSDNTRAIGDNRGAVYTTSTVTDVSTYTPCPIVNGIPYFKDTNTTYTLPAATSSALGGVKVGSNITNSSGTISLTKANVTAALGYTPPTTNTTYSAGTGISLSGTTFSNSGVRSIGTGTANGTISVNTNGTAANVAVKGLGSAAYTNSTAYMPANKFIFDTYSKSITVGGTGTFSFTVAALTQRSGYTLMGYINKNSGYGDQWLISYGTYGSNIVAMVTSKYGASLTQTISCTAVWVKN
jgi:hypothetical protein